MPKRRPVELQDGSTKRFGIDINVEKKIALSTGKA